LARVYKVRRLRVGTLVLAALCSSVFASIFASVTPAAAHAASPCTPQLEHLDRGLVAAATPQGVFLSWRLLGNEVTGHTATGMAGADFHVYRDGRRIATVTDSTNYLDEAGTPSSRYRVAAVVRGVELRRSAAVTAWAGAYRELPLQKPADGVTPVGEVYTYSANDMSVGDLDGDGRYEYIVKWDPSNSHDVSIVGYTGPVYIDAYEADGTLLYRIDLGVNIRAGAHYTQFLVYDFDGDGRAELMFKTAPGTKVIRYAASGIPLSEQLITMPEEDVQAGFSHADDYRLSSAGYYEHLVQMFLEWHAHPEVVAGHWPATLEAALGMAPTYAYPLSRADAQALADYFIDVYAPARSVRNLLRNFQGFIVDGPEYLSVFEGATGKELQTARYKPGRHDDGLMWGDYAGGRIEPGNRVDRFLATVAYLDGQRPSAVFARGYYTRTTLVAYDWDGRQLRERWYVDSGFVPMTNPFSGGTSREGLNPEFATLVGQGAHSLSTADVDGDGKQEIVYGSATIDDDGSLLYSSFDILPPGSANPGARVRLGHGDALHVTDIDPSRPGLEIYMVHESGRNAPYGHAMRDAATGEVLFGTYSGVDTGRGMVGDILPDEPGLEAWAVTGMGLWTADGDPLGGNIDATIPGTIPATIPGTIPGTNMSILWSGDMTTQIVNGALEVTPSIDEWLRGPLLVADGTLTNNGTKGTPSLVADIIGDWREELLVRTVDSSAIRIYLSTELTPHKLYTLMHDPQYRAEVARQQTTYNQPSYTSFHLGADTDWSRVPVPRYRAPRHR
jgi:rhamnogalacturonan endolyase